MPMEFRDWADLSRTALAIGQIGQQQQDRQRKQEIEEQKAKAFQFWASNPDKLNTIPEELSDLRPEALSDARVLATQQILGQQAIQSNKLALGAEKNQAALEPFKDSFLKGKTALLAGDYETAKNLLVPAYNQYMADGHVAEPTKDGLKVTAPTGVSREYTNDDLHKLVQAIEEAGILDPEGWQRYHWANKLALAQLNAKNMLHENLKTYFDDEHGWVYGFATITPDGKREMKFSKGLPGHPGSMEVKPKNPVPGDQIKDLAEARKKDVEATKTLLEAKGKELDMQLKKFDVMLQRFVAEEKPLGEMSREEMREWARQVASPGGSGLGDPKQQRIKRAHDAYYRFLQNPPKTAGEESLFEAARNVVALYETISAGLVQEMTGIQLTGGGVLGGQGRPAQEQGQAQQQSMLGGQQEQGQPGQPKVDASQLTPRDQARLKRWYQDYRLKGLSPEEAKKRALAKLFGEQQQAGGPAWAGQPW